MERTNMPKSLGNLLDSNIFNFAEKGKLNTKSKNTQTRKDKVLFKDLIENQKSIIVIWPSINTEAFSATMDNYRIYISEYNKRIKKANNDIEEYNSQVKKYCQENALNSMQKE